MGLSGLCELTRFNWQMSCEAWEQMEMVRGMADTSSVSPCPWMKNAPRDIVDAKLLSHPRFASCSRRNLTRTSVLTLNKPFSSLCLFFQQPQSQPQPIRIIPSQSAQPTSLPKPVPSVQHAARPTRPPHTPHAASLPTCPGRGKMSKFLSPDEMTSRDYYFDSYAHFGIHEVRHTSYNSENHW